MNYSKLTRRGWLRIWPEITSVGWTSESVVWIGTGSEAHPTNRKVNLRQILSAVAMAIVWTMSSRPASFAWTEQPRPRPGAIRGEIILPRAGHDWMSQQVEEPCILPNPKAPGRLIMFYSAVSSSNRVVAAIGKAWADTAIRSAGTKMTRIPCSDPPHAAGTPPPSASTASSTYRRKTLTTSTIPAPRVQFRTGSDWRSVRRARTAIPA